MGSFTSMTRPSFPRTLLFIALIVSAVPVTALDKAPFARSLEAEGDYYRAVGEWKQIRFEADAEATYWLASQSILVDLWKARQFELGLGEIRRLTDRAQTTSPELLRTLAAWDGILNYQLRRYPASEFSLNNSGTPLYLGLLLARTGRADSAALQWKGLELPDPTLATDARSPLLASLLSTALPGSGQVYAGHWYDGAQAAAFVSFFGLAAYGTYLYDSKFSPNYVLTWVTASVTAIFYASNIYGAYKTAEYFNQNQVNAQMETLESAVFSRPLPDLTLPVKP